MDRMVSLDRRGEEDCFEETVSVWDEPELTTSDTAEGFMVGVRIDSDGIVVQGKIRSSSMT